INNQPRNRDGNEREPGRVPPMVFDGVRPIPLKRHVARSPISVLRHGAVGLYRASFKAMTIGGEDGAAQRVQSDAIAPKTADQNPNDRKYDPDPLPAVQSHV